MGFLGMTRECAAQASANDFAQKLYNTDQVVKHKRFSRPRWSQEAFTIDHYAGDVTYNVEHFLNKNKDFVINEHQDLLGKSIHKFVKRMFQPEPEMVSAEVGHAKQWV